MARSATVMAKALLRIPPSDRGLDVDVGYPLGKQIYEFLERMASPEDELTTEEYCDMWHSLALNYLEAWDVLIEQEREDSADE